MDEKQQLLPEKIQCKLLVPSGVLKPALILFTAIKGHPELEMLIKDL